MYVKILLDNNKVRKEDIMNPNIELLEYIYESAEMGSTSMDRLCELLESKDNSIKLDISETQKLYDRFLKRSTKVLKEYKAKAKPKSMMSEMMSKMGIKKEINNDNSDTAVAKMIIEGLNMGIVDMESKIKQYSDLADKKIIKLAKEYLKFQKDEVENYKDYL